MKNKNFKYLTILLISMIAIIIIAGGSFAYFSGIVSSNQDINTSVKTAKLAMNLEGCQTLDLIDIVPGASKSCTFTVTNTGTKYLIYDYQLSDVYNELSRTEDLVYTVTKNGELKVNKSFPVSGSELISTDNCLGPLDTDTYVVTITYLDKDTDQSEDMNKKATANIEVTNIDYADECIIRSYTVKIDPTPGMYKGSKEASLYTASLGDEISIEDATSGTKTAYTFAGWNASDGKTYTNLLTVRGNVTLAAKWDINPDAVSRIDDVYYMTLEEANANAKDGDTITMIKNDTENVVFDKDVTLDLNGFNINGTITNTRDLIINGAGTIKSTEDAIINTGTLTIGENDGIVSVEAPYIEGAGNGINNQGEFNFYDGMIIGLEANSGYYDLIPDGYYVFVNHDDNTNIQKAWLVSEVDTRAICRINKVLFMNLNDAISSRDLSKIIFIRDAELAYDITIPEGHTRTIDIAGYTINSGYSVINNGNLTLTDTGLEAGIWNNSVTITNNNYIKLDNMHISATTNANTITNKGNMDIIGSTIRGLAGYAIHHSVSENITFDENSSIISNTYGLYNSGSNITISGGHIGGINSTGTNVNFNDIQINTNGIHCLNLSGGSANINNASFNCTNASAINGSNSNVLMYSGSLSNSGNYPTVNVSGGTFNLKNGNINVNNSRPLIALNNNATLTIDGGNLYNSRDRVLEITSSQAIINGGNIKGSEPVGCGGSFDCTLTINGGEIESTFGVAIGVMNYGNVYINGGKIIGYDDAINVIGGSLVVNDAEIIGNNIGINSNRYGTVYVNGGTVTGKNSYGIYNSYSLTLGSNDGTINNSPIITGKTYGIYNASSFYYYDGVIYGRTGAYYGNVTSFAKRAIISKIDEIKDEINYQKAYLELQPSFLEANGELYNNFEEAIGSINDTGTISVISDASIAEAVTIPNGKNITFDINGYTLVNAQTFTNKGTFNVINSKAEGMLKNSVGTIFSNSGTINIINGTYQAGGNILDNSGTAIVSDGTYTASNHGFANSGTLNVLAGQYNTTKDSFYITGGFLNVKGGNYRTNYDFVEATRGSIIIDYADVVGDNFIFGTNYNVSVTVNDGNFESLYNRIFGVDNNLTVNGGNFLIKHNDSLMHCNGTATINGGTFKKSGSGELISSYYYEYLTVNGGTFINENGPIANVRGTMIVTGGEFYANTRAITNEGTLIIGNSSDEINIESPYIFGKDYAIVGNFNFYDGALVGRTSFANTISNMPVGSEVKYEDVLIDDVTYQKVTLNIREDFLEIDGTLYNSFSDALNNVSNGGTIKLIKSVSIAESITSNKNYTFDLNGYTLTNNAAYNNQGVINIIDGIGTGGISSNTNIIVNSGTVTINGGTYNSSGTGFTLNGGTFNVINGDFSASGQLFVLNTATLNITDGNFNSNNGLIYCNNGNGYVDIQNGIFNSNATGIRMNQGSAKIENGTFNSKDVTVSVSYGSLTINDGYFKSQNDAAVVVYGSPSTINNGTFISETGRYTIYSNTTLSIYDGTYELRSNSSDLGAVVSSTSGNIKIYDGSFVGNNSPVIYNSNVVNIIGGNITSQNSYGVLNSGTIYVGNEDVEVNNIPVIIGNTYAIYNNGTFRYTDGILKGKNYGYNNVSWVLTDYDVKTDIETIDDEDFYVNSLIPVVNFVTNGENEYFNLQTAINEASSGDTLLITKDSNVYSSITIPSDKDITIDLNGYTMNCYQRMVNNGTLNIINNGIINNNLRSSGVSLILNNGIMNINDITFNYYYVLNNTGTLNLNNVIINANNYAIYNSNILSIDSSNISSSSTYALYNTFENIIITNTSFSAPTYAIYTTKNINVSDGDIVGGIRADQGIKLENINIDSKNYNVSSLYLASGDVVLDNIEIIGTSGYQNQSADIIYSKANITGTNLTVSEERYQNSNYASDYNTNMINIAGGSINMDQVEVNYIQSKTSYYTNGLIYNTNQTSKIDKLIINGTDTIDHYSQVGLRINSGELDVQELDIDLTSSSNATSYGVYISSGTLTFNTGSIHVTNSNTGASYGVYVDSGTVVMGLQDRNVSESNPEVIAVGNTGIGVKKVNGYFKYYDGLIKGSTSAKPETTSLVEPGYEVAFYFDENNYNYCILEYLDD